MWTVAVCVMVFVSFMLQEFECRPWILAGTWLILLASIGMTVYNGPMPTPPDSYWRKLLLEQSNVYFSGIFVILAAKTKLTWDITLT